MPPKTAEKFVAADTRATEAAKASAARQRDLDAAISAITRAYGDGSIMRLGDARALRRIEVIPTGALALDLALGWRHTARAWWKSLARVFGKTTLMLHVIHARRGRTGGIH